MPDLEESQSPSADRSDDQEADDVAVVKLKEELKQEEEEDEAATLEQVANTLTEHAGKWIDDNDQMAAVHYGLDALQGDSDDDYSAGPAPVISRNAGVDRS